MSNVNTNIFRNYLLIWSTVNSDDLEVMHSAMPKRIQAAVTTNDGACADPGIFVRGVQVCLTKKLGQRFFFFFFFSPQLILQKSNVVNFKGIYHFSRFQRGSNIFQGGSNFFEGGGVQLLIPYRNPYNL